MLLAASGGALAPSYCRNTTISRPNSHFLVDFDRSYLRQFEAYEDSDSTFLCAAHPHKSDGIFRFFIRYREGAEVV